MLNTGMQNLTYWAAKVPVRNHQEHERSPRSWLRRGIPRSWLLDTVFGVHGHRTLALFGILAVAERHIALESGLWSLWTLTFNIRNGTPNVTPRYITKIQK